MLWRTHGIVVINAEKSLVLGNEVSNAFFGIWACDLKGRLFFNDAHNNVIGIVVQDRGIDNTVIGGDQVDISLDPCF